MFGTPRLGTPGAPGLKLRGLPAEMSNMPGRRKAGHHSVYVVYLRNPKGDGKAGYYVGMTGLSPEERLANHKNGVKAAGVVKRFGVRLVPTLYEHLNPMRYEDAVRMEVELADSLRKRGFQVFGGH
jgi:predicted GIY-YIG superfamily endonuclease